jgi:hypothetical protein
VPKCKNCGKEFKQPKRAPKKLFCDINCIREYRKKETAKKRESVTRECLWCRVKFHPSQKHNKFCGKIACIRNFNTIKSRIYTIFPFDETKQKMELQKLKQLGRFYVFPPEFDDLNQFYKLEGKKDE